MAKKKATEAHGRNDAEAPAPSPAASKEADARPGGKRQPSGGYVQPDLPLRHIPTPF